MDKKGNAIQRKISVNYSSIIQVKAWLTGISIQPPQTFLAYSQYPTN